MLAHLVSYENQDMLESYKKVREELKEYGKGLYQKEEIIILSKMDLAGSKEEIKETEKLFSSLGKQVFSVSLFDDKSVKRVSEVIATMLQ